jgi:hypothetical protein
MARCYAYFDTSLVGFLTILNLDACTSSYRAHLKDPPFPAPTLSITSHVVTLKESNALIQNDMWCLLYCLACVNVVTGKWIFRHKLTFDGSFVRYKARWVVRCFTQQARVDYGSFLVP